VKRPRAKLIWYLRVDASAATGGVTPFGILLFGTRPIPEPPVNAIGVVFVDASIPSEC